jgi:hypothetical protein
MWVKLLVWTGGQGKEWSNELWYAVTGTPVANFDAHALAIAFTTAITPHWADLINQNYNLLGCDVAFSNGTYTVTASGNTTTPGAKPETPLPPEDSIVVRLQANVGGGSGRGRIFIGGLDSDMTDGSYLSDEGASNAATLITTLRTPLTNQGITCNLNLYSRKNGDLKPLVSMYADDILGAQLRRRPKR